MLLLYHLVAESTLISESAENFATGTMPDLPTRTFLYSLILDWITYEEETLLDVGCWMSFEIVTRRAKKKRESSR